MDTTRVILVLALGCTVSLGVGCSEGPSRDADADSIVPGGEAAAERVAADTGTHPRFIAGTYELVLVRGEPLFDDSGAVRSRVDGSLPWDVVDAARDWRDSAKVLFEIYERSPETSDEEEDLRKAQSATDSANLIRGLFEDSCCAEWQSAATLELDAAGQFVTVHEMRSYCRGKSPAFTRRSVRGTPSALESCGTWEAPAPGMALHLACRDGRWWNGSMPFRYVGDTLSLATDCDGTDTYVLRSREIPPVAVGSSDIARLDEC